MTTTTVVSVISAKGGSGKTVLSLSAARFLAGLGFKVLVVDADAATNGATLFLLDEVVDFVDSYDGASGDGPRGLFEHDDHLPDVMPTSHGFDVIPAAFRMRDTVSSAAAMSVYDRMHDLVDELRAEEFDIVIIDNEAGIERSSVTSAAVSDRVVIVSEFDPISAQGVTRLQRLHAEALPEARTWVLFNKVLPEFADSISDTLVAIKYLPPVGWTADVVRRYAVNELDIDVEKPSDFTLAVANAVDVMLGRNIRQRITSWRSAVAEQFEAALQTQRDILRGQLSAKQEHVSLASRWRLARGMPFLLLGAVLGFFVLRNSGIPLALLAGVLVPLATVAILEYYRNHLPDWDRPADQDQLRVRLNEIELLLSPTRLDQVDLAELRRRIQAIETDLDKGET